MQRLWNKKREVDKCSLFNQTPITRSSSACWSIPTPIPTPPPPPSSIRKLVTQINELTISGCVSCRLTLPMPWPRKSQETKGRQESTPATRLPLAGTASWNINPCESYFLSGGKKKKSGADTRSGNLWKSIDFLSLLSFALRRSRGSSCGENDVFRLLPLPVLYAYTNVGISRLLTFA